MNQQYQPQTIQVVIRMKPPGFLQSTNVSYDHQSITFNQNINFTFDHIFDHSTTQDQVFKRLGVNMIDNIIKGYNGCIFAYGQTGSGKTHTMTGMLGNQGLIQRCLSNLWNLVQLKFQSFEMTLSYFQIYNETILDLLNEKEEVLNIRQNVQKGFFIQKLTQHKVQHLNDFQVLIDAGMAARTTKETKMNATSSRSHSILTLNLVTKSLQNNSVIIKHSKLNFVDLAGSERQKLTLATGERLKQAANINKSLAQLSLVINRLADRASASNAAKKNIFVPFRNSVLTKILKPSLSQNSKTIIITTISTCSQFLQQSLATLRFAQTAKNIKIYASVNQEIQGNKHLLNKKLKQLQEKYLAQVRKCNEIQKQNQQLKLEHIRLLEIIQNSSLEMQSMAEQINKFRKQSQYYSIESQKTQKNTSQKEIQINSQLQNLKQSQIYNRPYEFNLIEQNQLIAPSQCSSFIKTNSFFTINQVCQKQQYDSPQKISAIFEQSPYNIAKNRLHNKIVIMEGLLKIKQIQIQQVKGKLKIKSDYQQKYQNMFEGYKNSYQLHNYPQAQKMILLSAVLKVNELQQQLKVQKSSRKNQAEQLQSLIKRLNLNIEQMSIGNIRLTQIRQSIKKLNANQTKSMFNIRPITGNQHYSGTQNYFTQINVPPSEIIYKKQFSSQSIDQKSNFEMQIKLKVQIDKFKRQLKTSKEEADRFRVLHQLDSSKIQDLQCKVNQLKDQNQILEEQSTQKISLFKLNKSITNQNLSLLQQLKKLKIKIQAYQTQNSQNQKKLFILKDIELKLQNSVINIENKQKILNNFQNRLNDLSVKNEKLNKQLLDSNMINQKLRVELSESKKMQIESHQQLLHNYQMSKNLQENLKNHYEGQVQYFKTLHNDFQNKLREKEDQTYLIQEKQNRIILLSSQNQRLLKLVNDDKKSYNFMTSKSQKLGQYNQSLKSEKINELIDQINFLKSKHVAQTNQYRRKVKQLQLTVQNISNKQKVLVNQLLTLKNQKQQIECQHQQSIKNLNQLFASEKIKFHSQNSEIQDKLKDMTYKCQTMNQENQFLANAFNQKKKNIQHMKIKIKKLQSDLADLQKQNQNESKKQNKPQQYNLFQSSQLSILYQVIQKSKQQNQILKDQIYHKDQLIKKNQSKIADLNKENERISQLLKRQIEKNQNQNKKTLQIKRESLHNKEQSLTYRQNTILLKQKYEQEKRKCEFISQKLRKYEYKLNQQPKICSPDLTKSLSKQIKENSKYSNKFIKENKIIN